MSNAKPAPVRALSLLSGGLDSQLAVCVLRDQGIEVHGLVFESPFFTSASAEKAAEQFRVPLHILPFSRDIIGLVRHPPHGFGSGMNPCIDCHALMLRRAGEFMLESGFHFLSTGEVLDERPMSQNRRSLETVARESGFGEQVLRPLSAKLLPETRPETLGWVDRSRLLDLRGKCRRPQMQLAARYGILDYPTPAGGCLLTEPNYAARLRDLRSHEGLDDMRAVERLRMGRHFRLDSRTKLVVGRNRLDNEWLEGHAGPNDRTLCVQDVPGPTALLPATAPEHLVGLAASVCARYADCAAGAKVSVVVKGPAGSITLEVAPADHATVERLMVRNSKG